MKPCALFACSLMVLLVFFFSGCGKEGPPLPPVAKTPELSAPAGLSGFVDHQGYLVLQWQYPDLSAKTRKLMQGFEIFAAVTDSDECKDCPLVFTKVGTTRVPRFSMESEKGKDYMIKVRAIGANTKIVSPYSETITLPYPKVL